MIAVDSTHGQYSPYNSYGQRQASYGVAPRTGYPSYSQDTVNYQRYPGGTQVVTEDRITQYPNGERDVSITKVEREPVGMGYGTGYNRNVGYAGGYGKRKRRSIVEDGSRDSARKSSPTSSYSGK